MLQPHQRYFTFKELNEEAGGGQSGGGQSAPEKPSFHAFGGKGYALSSEDSKASAEVVQDPNNPEIAEAIEMSKVIYLSELEAKLPAEPAEKSPDAVTLSLRLPTGKTVRRRFLRSSPLGVVEDFCKIELGQVEDLKLICSYPRKVFADMKVLVGIAFDSDSTVIVEKF